MAPDEENKSHQEIGRGTLKCRWPPIFANVELYKQRLT
jgi:hypothetical protein